MNEYGLWNILAVFIAAAAFIATQVTARRNERAEFLLTQVDLMTKDVKHLTEELRDRTLEVKRLQEENVELLRKIAAMQNR